MAPDDSVSAGSSLPWEPTAALGLFVQLLSEIESATPSSADFYDRLCQATCRLAHLRRAVIFLWDDSLREVRAVGSLGIDLPVFADHEVAPTNVPIARQSLVEDQVVFAHDRFAEHIPAELVEALAPRNLVCTPMSAGGVWFGVLVGEREENTPPTEAEKHTLWTLGKVAALAASARGATRQQERARRLSDRMDLARAVHDSAIQRMFGVTMALSVDGPVSDEHRRRCLDEITEAMSELREAMQRPLAAAIRPPGPRFADVLRSQVAEHAEVRLHHVPGADVPLPFDGVAQHVLVETIRNARKHARASVIDVRLERRHDDVVLIVANDGAQPAQPRSGMGLQLVSLEALQAGAMLKFGPEGSTGWSVRLTMPAETR